MERFSSVCWPNANHINSTRCTSGTGKVLDVYDKFSGKLLATLPEIGEEELEEAIAGSVSAFKEMKRWSAGTRKAHLVALLEELRNERENLTHIIAAEAGKPLFYAAAEVERSITTLQAAAEETTRFAGEMVPVDFGIGEGKTAFTLRTPVGPVAAISPFNFPLNLAMHKIAPAFAVGASVVLKPSPFAPLSALYFAALVERVGYPAGALNVFHCAVPLAEKFVSDPRLPILSFTGSPSVGWHLKRICSMKKVLLELGGNAAVIIDSGADLYGAARQIALGAFLYAGQICISTQRIYVVHDEFGAFLSLLRDETQKIKAGNPFEEGVVVGPMIDAVHLERVEKWVSKAIESGAELLLGGNVLSRKNNLYAPTLLTRTTPEMEVVSDEVFGPVAIVEQVADFKEAVLLANASRFGLQAGVFTQNIAHMKYAAKELEVGGVIINGVPGFRIDTMPYGGVKESGVGREGVRYAMDEFTEPRLVIF